MGNCSNPEIVYDALIANSWASWNAAVDYFEYQPWFFSLLGSAMVGLSGILPLYIIPIDEGANLKNGAGAGTLKLLLSFAVGGLLGDVFLHLLPEAWASKAQSQVVDDNSHPPMTCGLWVLSGFLVFIIAEKMFINEGENSSEEKKVKDDRKSIPKNDSLKGFENNNCLISSGDDVLTKLCTRIGSVKHSSENQSSSVLESKLSLNKSPNGFKAQTNGFAKLPPESMHSFFRKSKVEAVIKCKKNEQVPLEKMEKPKHISGYLNLMANCIDNFTHGLAVGGSFLISFRLGALTTFAILVHEIPHEVGDFAILLRSGFNRWDAARAQLLTASGGIFGALVAVLCSGSGVESRTSWILPFTAGGFLHIGMVSVLPELLKETNPKESLKQLGALLAGITIMGFLTAFCD